MSPISTVVFLPIYQNPYQHLLTAGLQDLNVDVLPLQQMPSLYWLYKQRQKVDILHMHWLSSLYMWRYLTPLRLVLFLTRFSYAQRLGYKTIWTAHNILPHNLPFPPLHRFVRRFVMHNADAVIVHCEYGRSKLLHQFPRKKPIFVIPHGNYDGIYPVDKTRSQACSALDIKPQSFVYLLIGNISPYKGIDLFIDAFRDAAAQDDVVIIAGRNRSPGVVARLEELAAIDKRIRLFPGLIAEDQMQLYLLAADVVFFTFVEILTSGTVILALTHGLPVVAPAMGCLPELISADAGLLYQTGEPKAIRKAIRDIKRMDLAAMRHAARQTAEQLRWDQIAKQTLAVYRVCLDGA